MLVPLTDSTNPYAVMMLELIRTQRTEVSSAHGPAAPTPVTQRRDGIRGRLGRSWRGAVAGLRAA